MSFLNKVKTLKEKTTNSTKTLKLRKLSNNVFPYSCLVDSDVLLTKNGEVLQIIEIALSDFKQNQEGGLREKIRQAIAENTTDLKTAFWFQTVKRKKARSKTKHKIIKHELLRRLYNVSQELEQQLNNYETKVYITIIRQGRNFHLKYFKDYISSFFLEKQHDNFIEKSVQELKEITRNIVNVLSIYNPKVLGIRKELENKEYSEIIELLYFLVNFEDKKVEVEPIDASNIVNNSKYLFENGIMAMQNQDSKKIRMGMSFSLKEVPNIKMTNVSDIINNTRAEMIITEYISYVDQKFAISKFREQKAFLSGRPDKRFQNEVGLGFLDGDKETKYCQSSISIIVLASNTKELQTFVNDAIMYFSKHGIVMAREDVSLERNYYAMLPANFSSTHRLTIHDAKDVACFCYSYIPQENDTKDFFNETILFNIGTLKNNPVPIGLDKNNHNIMVGGLFGSGKTTIANFLTSAIMREFDATRLYTIEFNCRSRAFVEAMGGKFYSISANKIKHNCFFNGLDLKIFNRATDIDEYLSSLFSLLLIANNVIMTPEITTEIQKVINKIKDYNKINNDFTLHDIRNFFQDLSIEQELLAWHSIGKYYHLFDNKQNVFNTNKLMSIKIEEDIAKDSNILASIIYYIFTNIGQIAEREQKPIVVVLEEPFLAFGNSFFKNKLNKIIEQMAKNDVFCIFKVSDIQKESASIVDFNQLVNSCGLQVHFANKYADSNYGRVFGIEKLEYMTIKTLNEYEGKTMIVKEGNNKIFSCQFNLDEFPKTLGILSDKGETQNKIFQIKEALQTEAIERWVPAYFGTFNPNDDIQTKRAVQQEIKAIQDIKRLLES